MNIQFNKNEDINRLAVSDVRKRLAKVYLGGGKKRIENQHAKGKMTALERIDYLIDKGSRTVEVGAFTGDGMYKEYGGCPSGGVVVVIGYVKERQCIIVANDATVKAGAWFPITRPTPLFRTYSPAFMLKSIISLLVFINVMFLFLAKFVVSSLPPKDVLIFGTVIL